MSKASVSGHLAAPPSPRRLKDLAITVRAVVCDLVS